MPVISFHPVARRSALIASIGAVALAGVPAPALAARATASPSMSMEMPMGSSTPEHVAEALAALKKGQISQARVDLRRAIHSKDEPMDAGMHAKEAVAALNTGDRAMALMHAANGAAVEHLTYALDALRAGHFAMARGHLGEALSLPRVRKYAKAAISAVDRGDRSGARREIRVGLKAANHD